MKKNNTKCVVCGKEYYYCNTCKSQDPSWMISFCSDNCRKIYNAVAKFGMGKLTQEQAKDALKDLDLSKYDNFTDSTKRLISEINKIDEKEELEEEKKDVQNEQTSLEENKIEETTYVRKARPSRTFKKKKGQ